MKFDHVALEVADLDGHIRDLVDQCDMRLLRMGTRFKTGQRIAMLGDGTGTKLELIEANAQSPTFAHIAFRTGECEQDVSRLTDAGWEVVNPPHRLDSAKAQTSLLKAASQLPVQVITYDSDSPEDVRWNDNSTSTNFSKGDH
jgi:hypothetical protein